MATEPRRTWQQWLRDKIPSGRNEWLRFGGQVGAGVLGGPAASLAFGQMFRDGNFNNPLTQLATAGRGLGTSVNRLFDNNSNTGFFNNPTAPWNWGNGPSNVPEGHPDFVGPTQGNRGVGPQGEQIYSPGDPRQWGPFQNPIGQQGMNNWYSDRTGNSFTGNTTQNPIIGYGVASPEQIAAAGSYGVGVNPDGTYSGAGGRNSPSTSTPSSYGGSRVMDAIGSAYGSGPAGLLGMGVRGALLGPRPQFEFNTGIRPN